MPRMVLRYNPETGTWDEIDKNRGSDPKVYVQSDEMAPTVHPCDGSVHESKSSFRRVTKAHGCVEVGSGGLPTKKEWEPTGIRETLIDIYRNR